eukprot:g1985.t1
MNIFRLAGDFSHLASYLILLYVLFKKRNAAVFKIFYIAASGAICWLIMMKEPWRSTNDKSHDTFRIEFLMGPCFLLALLINYDFSFMEIMWTFSIYLESVAILPQLFVLHRTQRIANFTSHYVFTLGAYRALYILNWIYRFFTEYYYRQYIVWIAGVVQTALYLDFFLHYFKAKKQGFDKDILLPTSTGKQG